MHGNLRWPFLFLKPFEAVRIIWRTTRSRGVHFGLGCRSPHGSPSSHVGAILDAFSLPAYFRNIGYRIGISAQWRRLDANDPLVVTKLGGYGHGRSMAMRFLFYFAVCLGSFLLSLQLFTSTTTQKSPEDFFAQFHRQAETYSTQSSATKPAPAPEMIESAPDVSAATPETATPPPNWAVTTTEAVTTPEAATTPEAVTTPETATTTESVTTTEVATTPAVAGATLELAATPNATAATPDVTPASVVAGQPETQLVPNVVRNARAEAAPKKTRVARKYPRDDDPRNPIWWLWGLSNLR